MKNLKTLTGFLMLALLMSCGNGQKSTPSSPQDTPNAVSNDNASSNTTINDTSNSSSSATSNMSSNSSVGDTMNMKNSRTMDNRNMTGNNMDSIVNDTRMTKMFSALNLTENQMKEFRLNAHKNLEAWRKNNENATLTNEERMRQEEENVKSFLEPAQYEKYQQWVKDNPYKSR